MTACPAHSDIVGGWRLRAGVEFLVRRWPGEEGVVIHDPESGDTHLLSAEAFRCLEAFRRGEVPAAARDVIRDLHHFRLIEPS